MGLKPLVAALLLLSFALAGCSGDGGDDDAAPATSTSATGSRSSTGTTMAAANRAPTGSAALAVNGTSAAFTLDGTDPDGDALSWNLTFGDGQSTSGATLPANATHDYGAAGRFNATFTLSDGKASAVYNLTINATVAAAGGAPQVSYQFTGSLTGSWNPATGYLADPATHTFEVTQAGLTLTAALTEGPTAPDLDYELLDPSGDLAAEAAGIFPADGTEEPDLVVADAELGTWTLNVYAGNALEGGYTVDITFA
jgi:hypothetical protein